MKIGADIDKKIVVLVVILSSMALVAYLVSAATGDTVKVISPASGSNHSETALFNVSYSNNTDGIRNALNATFFYLNSTQWISIGNTSSCASNSCSATLDVSSLPDGDGSYSINSTISNASTTISIIHSANLSTSVIFDSVNPLAQEANFSSLSSGSNHSGTLILNISVSDATSSIETVFFNITNSTGVQNTTISATNSAGNQWNATLNTSTFLDGTYNISAFINDTAGNINDTAKVNTIIFDNTNPSPSTSCSPTSVKTGESFPCTCSGSDATSGVSATSDSSTSPDGTGTPANTGTFTYSCSVTDLAGNSASSNTQYTVTSSGGSNSGGGSSSGGGGSSSSSADNNDSPEETEQIPEETQGTSEEDFEVISKSPTQSTSASTIGWIIGIIIGLAAIISIVYFARNKKRS